LKNEILDLIKWRKKWKRGKAGYRRVTVDGC